MRPFISERSFEEAIECVLSSIPAIAIISAPKTQRRRNRLDRERPLAGRAEQIRGDACLVSFRLRR